MQFWYTATQITFSYEHNQVTVQMKVQLFDYSVNSKTNHSTSVKHNKHNKHNSHSV